MTIPAGSGWSAASYFYDGAGNVTTLVADDGSVAASYTYGPFGERLTATGLLADLNPYQYSSKERDEITGYYYFGYRSCDPLTGRWLNRDPLEEEGGLNIYAYVSNAPGTYLDPLGLCASSAPNYMPNGGGGGGSSEGGSNKTRGQLIAQLESANRIIDSTIAAFLEILLHQVGNYEKPYRE